MAWYKTENQRFVDPSRYPADHPLDGDDGNSSEENDDDEESQDGLSGNEDGITGQEAAKVEAETGVDIAIATPMPGEEEEENPAATPSRERKPEEDAVLRFLDVVEDHDAHRASVERLRNFFDNVHLKQLNGDREGIEGETGCQTVLDDRNFTSRLYRGYRRPLSPREVYKKLMEKVTAPIPLLCCHLG